MRDLPSVETHLLDTGHFALETHGGEIASRIEKFFVPMVDNHRLRAADYRSTERPQ